MSGFPVPPQQTPGSGNTAPWDFATFLQKTADLRQVTQGIGGTTVVLDKEALFAPPPSQEGIGGAKTSLNVRTGEPKLDDPAFAGLGLWSMQFATTITNILVGTLSGTQTGVDVVTGDGESLASTLAFREAALQQALEEAGITSPEAEAHVSSGAPAGVEGEGPSEQAADVGDTSIHAAFVSWYNSLAQTMSTQLPSLSSATQSLLATIHSTDVGTITKSLIEMSDLPSLNLSQKQQVLIKAKLGELASTIGAANHAGGAFVLNMTVPAFMLPVMMETLDVDTDTTMSVSDKEALSTALYTICTQLAAANFEESVSTKPSSSEYSALVSGNLRQVSSLLSTIVGTMPLPPGISNTDMQGALDGIASTLCSLNTAGQETLESVDTDGLTALFTNGLTTAVASGAISPDVEVKLAVTLVPLLVSQISDINRAKLTADLSSKDSAAIGKSLTLLTKVKSDPMINTPTKRVIMSYIQVLVSALVYISNMRSLMLQMETEFTQKLATAKMENIATQAMIAKEAYVASLQQISTTYASNIAALEKKHLMAWLGPLIMVLVSVLMLVVTVVLLVLSGGTLAPVLIGTIVAAITALTALVSAICSWTTGEDMWTQLCKVMGIKNPTIVNLISTVVQILIQIIAIIATAGAMAAYYAVAEVAEEGMEAAADEITDELVTETVNEVSVAGAEELPAAAGGAIGGAPELVTETVNEVSVAGAEELPAAAGGAIGGAPEAVTGEAAQAGEQVVAKAGGEGVAGGTKAAAGAVFKQTITRVVLYQVVEVVVTNILGDGLVTDGLQSLAQKIYKNDPKKAGVFTMIMSVLVTLVVAGATGHFSAKMGGAAAGGVAKAAAEEAAQTVEEEVEETVKETVGDVKAFFGDIKTALVDIEKGFRSAATKFLSSLKDTAKKWSESLDVEVKKAAQEVEKSNLITNIKNKVEVAMREFRLGSDAADVAAAAGDILKSGATAAFSLRNILKNTFITVMEALVNGLKNFGMKLLRDIKQAVDLGGKGVEGLLKKLNTVTDFLKLVTFALQLTASMEEYQAAETEAYYDTMLAGMTKEVAILNATMKFFTDLDGLDQTETIKNVSATAQQASQNWTQLLKLVSDIIRDAGQQVTKMTSRAGV